MVEVMKEKRRRIVKKRKKKRRKKEIVFCECVSQVHLRALQNEFWPVGPVRPLGKPKKDRKQGGRGKAKKMRTRIRKEKRHDLLEGSRRSFLGPPQKLILCMNVQPPCCKKSPVSYEVSHISNLSNL